MLEQVWGRDLSDYDPDGPLPEDDPTGDTSITQGRVRHGDPIEVARRYRERAEAENLSIRELIIAVTSRQQFVGTADQIAAEIDQLHPGRRVRWVHSGAAPDAARSGRVRRPCRAATAGACRVPYRIQRSHAARAPRAGERAVAGPLRHTNLRSLYELACSGFLVRRRMRYHRTGGTVGRTADLSACSTGDIEYGHVSQKGVSHD